MEWRDELFACAWEKTMDEYGVPYKYVYKHELKGIKRAMDGETKDGFDIEELAIILRFLFYNCFGYDNQSLSQGEAKKVAELMFKEDENTRINKYCRTCKNIKFAFEDGNICEVSKKGVYLNDSCQKWELDKRIIELDTYVDHSERGLRNLFLQKQKGEK